MTTNKEVHVTKIFYRLQMFFHSPILWGGLMATGFYGLVYGGPLDYPLVRRYFTGHPVEFMETVMFSIGLSALVIRALELWGQRLGLGQSPLEGADSAEGTAGICQALLSRLEQLSWIRRQEYYIRRLHAALKHVFARGSAETLDEHLKYLSDLDAGRLHASFGLFRVILWAIPILGFLGTVIGITMALNSVDLKSLDQSSMAQALNGLGLKFDTTALALTLSMLLMFVHFFVDRSASGFLEEVDQSVERDLAGRFPQGAAGAAWDGAGIRRMAESFLQVADRLVERQAALWQTSIEEAAGRWTRMADSSGKQLHAALSGALQESLQRHAQQITAAEQALAEKSRRQWEQLGQTHLQHAQQLAAVQAAVAHQAEVLGRAVQAVGEVTRLEDALNRNLAALAGAKHFEQTVMSLAAALNLLGARLAETPAPTIKLESTRRAAQAA
jgi:biopolymer transport protein ExbB/TolQ